MTHLETELGLLKHEVKNMWSLVTSQLQKAHTALLTFDRDLAREIIIREKYVNSTELKIDRDCEDIFALYSPVAVDLRFVLAVLKINTNLERIGDIAEGIAKYVLDAGAPFTEEILKAGQIVEMFNEATAMLEDTQIAFDAEDTVLARQVFKKDEFLDTVNRSANNMVAGYLKKFPADLDHALYIISIIRKLERTGDHSKNIAEEIIFYVEAKVLKHSHKLLKAVVV